MNLFLIKRALRAALSASISIAVTLSLLLTPLAGTANASDYTGITINLDTSAEEAIEPGFSGFNTNFAIGAFELTDTRIKDATRGLTPGYLRYIAGTNSDAFDEIKGDYVEDWVNLFSQNPTLFNRFIRLTKLTRAKNYLVLKDFHNLANYAGAQIIVQVNGFSAPADDNGASGRSIKDLAQYAKDNNIPVAYWELSNEPVYFVDPKPLDFWQSATDYADKMKPYCDALKEVDTANKCALYVDHRMKKQAWNEELGSYPDIYWDALTYHNYFGGTSYADGSVRAVGAATYQDDYNMVNGALVYASDRLAADYILPDFPLDKQNMPILVTEWAVPDDDTMLQNTMYGGVFSAEYAMRMLKNSNIKHIGYHVLNKDGFADPAERSHETDLINAYNGSIGASPAAYCPGTTHYAPCDTTAWGLDIYSPVQGLAMAIVNEAINHSSSRWNTTISGSQEIVTAVNPLTQNEECLDALYAQGLKGNNGKNYVLITNKSDKSHDVTIKKNGVTVMNNMKMFYISSSDPKTVNVSGADSPIAIQTLGGITSGSATIPAYSVVRLEWFVDDSDTPTVPTGLTADYVDTKSAAFHWSPSSDAVAVTAYKLLKDGVEIGTSKVPSFNAKGLTANTSYTFNVQAKDAAGHTSAASAPLTVTTAPLDTLPPTSPAVATPVPSSDITDTSIRLNWAASTDNVGVTGYIVYLDNVNIATTKATHYTFTGLDGGTSYALKIKARDGSQNISTVNPTINVTTAAGDTTAPTVPTLLTSLANTDTTVTLTWSASSDDRSVYAYDVYKGGSWVGSWTKPTYTVPGLLPNTTYSFSVRARDAAGNQSALSSALSVTTAAADTTAPAQPGTFAIMNSGIMDTSINLRWDALTDANGIKLYQIFRDGVLDGQSTSKSYVVKNLTPNTTYEFKIKAMDVAGNLSAFSTPASMTTDQPWNVVQNNAGGWTYANWSEDSEAASSGCTLHKTTTANATASYTFTGTEVELYGWKNPGFGAVQISIDGSVKGTFSLDAAKPAFKTKIFGRVGLSNAAHTVQIKAVGSDYVNIDYLLYH